MIGIRTLMSSFWPALIRLMRFVTDSGSIPSYCIRSADFQDRPASGNSSDPSLPEPLSPRFYLSKNSRLFRCYRCTGLPETRCHQNDRLPTERTNRMFHIDARKLILAPMFLAAALTSAYADSNLFFYNADTGSGAVTTFSRTQPPATLSGQQFSSGWNLVTTG